MAVYEISTQDIRAVIDPLIGDTWKCGAIQVVEVTSAIVAHEFDERPWNVVKSTLDPALHRNYHISRIAFLASSPAMIDDKDKLIIAIGPDRTWIYDGHHRIAAAMVRGDLSVRVTIVTHDDSLIPKQFPSARKL